MQIFGHAMRKAWLLRDDIRFLNHGSFGATPRIVLEAQSRWRERMESDPVNFMADELPKQLRIAVEALANHLGGAGIDLAFVDNATTAVNAVVRSVRLGPGDAVLTTNHVYGAVRNTLMHICAEAGATLLEAPVPYPPRGPNDVISSIQARLSSSTRLVVLDHVTSDTALVFPVGELIAICHDRGIPVLIDGAHAPGMLALNLDALGADWYAGNCHKWLCAPKGCGFLWARRDRQATLHPTIISHGWGQGFRAEFDWQGTKDYSAWLSVIDAIIFLDRLGVGPITAYCTALVRNAAKLLATAWDTEIGTPPDMQGYMAAVRLTAQVPPTREACSQIRQTLLREHGIEAQLTAFGGSLWLRLSAFLYNELEDYLPLATLLADPAKLL